MSHRNTVLFEDSDRKLTLVAQGSFWPIAIEVDGETWERTQEVEEVSGRESMRVYRHAPFGVKRRSG